MPTLYLLRRGNADARPCVCNKQSVLYARCQPAYVDTSYYLNNALNSRKILPQTLDKVFVGQWRNRFLLPQNSNAPTKHLTTPHFKTNTPMGT